MKTRHNSVRRLRLESLERRYPLTAGCIDPPAGLVAWLPGDSNTQDLVSGNFGTLTGTLTYAPGEVGESFSILQPNDAVILPANPALGFERDQQFTIDGWAKTGDPTGLEPDTVVRMYEKGRYTSDNESYGIMLRPNFRWIDVFLQGESTNNRVYWRASVDDVNPSFDFTAWHNYAMTYNGDSSASGVNVYLDGVAMTPFYTESSLTTSIQSAFQASIGSPLFGRPETFIPAQIDELQVYDRALSQAEIQTVVDAGSAGLCKTTSVLIDIKPGSENDPLNLASQGVIPVTLLGSATFDVSQVSVSSVVFAGAHATQWSLGDINGDGEMDLILKFRTQDTNLRAVYESLLAAADTNTDGVLDSNISTQQTAMIALTGETLLAAR